MNEVEIIGIDCATQVVKVGLARGIYRQGRTYLTDVARGRGSVAEQVTNWLKTGASVLLALDAPLGWPEALGRGLVAHAAGQALPYEANCIFRRETDRYI